MKRPQTKAYLILTLVWWLGMLWVLYVINNVD